MTNRIRNVTVMNHRLDPHETDLRILVEVEYLTPTTEIKGRLMGPRNVHAATIEIAYPLKEIERGEQISLRAIIPEPSWWEPKLPFLYRGPLELWQDGAFCERVQIRHGINRLQLSTKGLRLNGKPLVIQGRVVESKKTEAEIRELRNDGFNLVLSPWDEGLTDLADEYGLFLLAYSHELPDRAFFKHACAFGWAVPRDGAGSLAETVHGVRTCGAPFSLGPIENMSAPDANPRPRIVLSPTMPNPLPTLPTVIGWIEAPTA
jgi:hypothetical protein